MVSIKYKYTEFYEYASNTQACINKMSRIWFRILLFVYMLCTKLCKILHWKLH